MLALIAGRGGLPAAVAQAQAVKPLVCALEGFAPDGVTPDVTFRLEGLGPLLTQLQARGVRDVCLCGGIDRPQIDPALIAPETLPLIPLLQTAIAAGDDGALRAVMSIFETFGFCVRAAHDLAPGLVVQAGVLTAQAPDQTMLDAAVRGDAVLKALAPLDVGQACVAGAGQVWGIETVGGTAHMLGALPPAVRQAGAVLVKRSKAGQDLRADMPTIGPDTITQLAQAGLAGMVLEAGRVLVLERDTVKREAEAAGLAIWAWDAP